MNDPIERALSKEVESIKDRLNEIEEIMSYSTSDLVDLENQARPLIELHKKTGDRTVLDGVNTLAERGAHIKAMLKLQEENGDFAVEKRELESDLIQIEQELVYRKGQITNG